MPFDLKNLNPPVRFYWPDSENKEWVELRRLTDQDRLKFIRETRNLRKHEFVLNPDSKRMERVSYVDTDLDEEVAFQDKVTDHMIVNWNFCEADGTEIPCSKENKLLMMNGSEVFKTWIMKCIETMEKDIKERKESEEKNLSTSYFEAKKGRKK